MNNVIQFVLKIFTGMLILKDVNNHYFRVDYDIQRYLNPFF